MVWRPYGTSAADPVHIALPGLTLEVDGAAPDITEEDGVIVVRLGGGRVEWAIPCADAVAYWTPDSDRPRWLPPSWARPPKVMLSRGAPVAVLIGAGDDSLCTAALSPVPGEAVLTGGVVEETGEFRFWAEYAEPFELRIDLRRVHFAAALGEVAAWWQGDSARSVPLAARLPTYCTWYALHQHVTAEAVEEQAVLAAGLGCSAIIVDDGWQTADTGRGYGHCGEWEPVFPDMPGHVHRVRSLGLAYILWFALPFLGERSAAWSELKPLLLKEIPDLQAGVLDPRHAEVRDFLTGKLSAAVAEWGCDGLKVDFVDTYADPDVMPALAQLLGQLDARLREVRPDVLVEHRQNYVSPLLWPYATMVRAADCPLSPAENRQRIIDLRLTAGPLAVHADPVTWHPASSPEDIAAQLINAIFGVPQISADLTALTDAQRAAVAFWLGFSREHLGVLQLGLLRPARAEQGYPLVVATDGVTTIAGRYSALPVEVPGGRLLVANADADERVILAAEPGQTRNAEVRGCTGVVVWAGPVDFPAGLATVRVPRGGLLSVA
ncbi:glycoside hydrolase family 36 protein [Longispora albida]|uniref:glycoside hydrolase family 36 protein n=1 Tax=Longispora albida TaxID=203523 RepID=UPI0003601C47|nr:glycoside hydrolase family 36 protein [Longispora albida]